MTFMQKWFAPLVFSAALCILLPLQASASVSQSASHHPEATLFPPEQLHDVYMTAPEQPSDANFKENRHKKMRWKSGLLGHPAHQRTYLTLLAEKYAPDSVSAWNSVLDESDQLHEQYRALFRSEKGKALHQSLKKKGFSDELKDYMKKHIDMKHKFTDAIESRDEGKIKAVLGELLVHCKERNVLMESKLKEWKEQS